MGDKSKIAWCDATWQVLAGCSRVSPGCENCYSERLLATRLKHLPWAKNVTENGHWNGQVHLRPEKLEEPMRWRRARRIFVADRGDLFNLDVPFEFIAAVFGVMAAAKQHTFLVLTKRPERMLEWFHWVASLGMLTCTRRNGEDPRDPRWAHYACVELAHKYMTGNQRKPEYDHRTPWPLPNVWLGVTCEDQERANERIPILLKCPASVRWVSAEPLLGPIDFGQVKWLPGQDALRWVIVGGESGPRARPFAYEWALDIRNQCDDALIPCFIKQMGSRPYVENWNMWDLPDGQMGYPIDRGPIAACEVKLRDRSGADPAEWPKALLVREYPNGL